MKPRKEHKPKKFIFSAYIKNAVRNMSYKYPSRTDALKAVRIPRPENWPNKRVKWVVPCAACKGFFEIGETQTDHIQPVIPVTGWPMAPKSDLYESTDDDKDMNVLIYRTFVRPEKLQIMCKPCHNIKSQGENEMRRES